MKDIWHSKRRYTATACCHTGTHREQALNSLENMIRGGWVKKGCYLGKSSRTSGRWRLGTSHSRSDGIKEACCCTDTLHEPPRNSLDSTLAKHDLESREAAYLCKWRYRPDKLTQGTPDSRSACTEVACCGMGSIHKMILSNLHTEFSIV